MQAPLSSTSTYLLPTLPANTRTCIHDLFDVLPFDNIENLQEVLNPDSRPASVFSYLSLSILSALFPITTKASSLAVSLRSRSLSSSSSDLDTSIVIMSNNNVASVVQSSTKHAPILTPWKISPTIAHSWENTYPGFQDTIISDWYYNDVDTYDAMSWKDFLSAFHSRFLPKGWESSILTQLLCSRQREDKSFQDWVLSIEKLNTILRGSPSRLDDAHLRAQISANICAPDLDNVADEIVVLSQAGKVEYKRNQVRMGSEMQ
ncbi:hypothetical protein SCP_0704140 [Sparassis crispa]|uniref:Retrotransposon gag domain-containing protein n=1 Tax=Sparassis crispa TaxID=139825 RepID=A0A401GSM1_9APHY|nr:hypothetical protein SCP_0704140 [Sparassis crispa]GBE85228.1 hypothetical protein SCP_0704140 [Sparassis crispa]